MSHPIKRSIVAYPKSLLFRTHVWVLGHGQLLLVCSSSWIWGKGRKLGKEARQRIEMQPSTDLCSSSSSSLVIIFSIWLVRSMPGTYFRGTSTTSISAERKGSLGAVWIPVVIHQPKSWRATCCACFFSQPTLTHLSLLITKTLISWNQGVLLLGWNKSCQIV
jgi:hypothetical protein